ncbi:hypothetical protein M758_4G119600 [Ceratodon purpureus]|nr:hypothetical protein M758_4G119600 [Ceratodon purpureus]
MASKRRREVGEEGEQEEVESLEEELRRERRKSWEVLGKRKVVGEAGDAVDVRPVGIFLRGTSTELVSYSKPMPFDKVLEELSIIRDCKSGVIFKRGSNRSMAGEVVLPFGEYDFLPSSLSLCDNARCLPMEGSTSSPPNLTNVNNLEKSPQCGPQPIPAWNRGVYPFVGNMPMLPMLGWGRGPSMPPLPHQANLPKFSMEHQSNPPKFTVEHQVNLPKFTLDHQAKPPKQTVEHPPNPPKQTAELQLNLPKQTAELQPNLSNHTVEHQLNPAVQMVDHQPKLTVETDEGMYARLLRNEGSPLLSKYEPRQTRKRKQKISLEDLTPDQIQEVKQGGHWKDHWVVHLIRIRGELANVFAAPPKQGVDNWGRLHRALITNCPDFNKDSEACRKKWAAIYKDYKHDKAANSTSGSVRSDKCKWYVLVDQYFFDRVNVGAQDDSAHESEGIPPTSTVSEVTLEVSPKSSKGVFLEMSV